MIVSAPASTANLGPGFDALGLALDVTMDLDVGATVLPEANHGHPAVVAFRKAGGEGPLGWSSKIPPGKGMGFSGASYVAGVAAAFAQRGADLDEVRDEVFEMATQLEGHPDNAAPSTYGGLTVATNEKCIVVPVAADLRVVMWIPGFETSTNASRATLPAQISHADATHNVGRTALLVAAMATGDLDVCMEAGYARLGNANTDLLTSSDRSRAHADRETQVALQRLEGVLVGEDQQTTCLVLVTSPAAIAGAMS